MIVSNHKLQFLPVRKRTTLDGPTWNPPKEIRLRFHEPHGRPLKSVAVNGKTWKKFEGEWVHLPGDVGRATVVARFQP